MSHIQILTSKFREGWEGWYGGETGSHDESFLEERAPLPNTEGESSYYTDQRELG